MVQPSKDILYNPFWIEQFFYQQPLWRRLFARLFNKYKFTEKEYMEWLSERFNK